jgi:hypothetical protein
MPYDVVSESLEYDPWVIRCEPSIECLVQKQIG